MEGSGAKGFGNDWRKEGEEERVSKGMEVSASGRMDDDGGLIGVYVGKNTSGTRFLLGKVLSYDGTSMVYRVLYEDGHQEDVERGLVREMVRMDDGAGKLTQRKRRLERIVPTGGLTMRTTRSRKRTPDVAVSVGQVSSEFVSVDADSSSDSCDHARVPTAVESSSFSKDTHSLPLELPPSSGDIAVPEDSISFLFSTYNFLRSFSLQLFLSPFGFDDYVCSLNCSMQNSLMDSIHLSLMRALSRHLPMLSHEGSIMASKCLRFYDWALLDMLTWPAFLAEYLFVMGYLKELESKEFIHSVLNGEYYCLNVATKLKVLQLLCDDVINSGELRTELGMRTGIGEDNEEGLDAYLLSQDAPTSLHHETSKTSSLKDRKNLRESVSFENQHVDALVSEADVDGSANSQDKNSDECCLCGMDGTLICCDGCPSAYHSRCIGLNKAFLPEGLWFCPECSINKIGPTSSRIRKGTSGAEVFGTDSHGHIFVGTCNYLLVLGTSVNEESISRYYNQDDIPKVLSLISSTQEKTLAYVDISIGISEYFEVPMASLKVDKSDSMRDVLANKEGALCYFPNSPSRNATDIINNSGDNCVSNIITSNSKHSVVNDDVTVDPATSVMDQAGISDAQNFLKENHDICVNKIPVIADEILVSLNNGNLMSGATDPLFLSKQIETRVKHGFGSVATDLSSSNPAIPAAKLIFVNNFSLSSGNGSEICKEEADSSIYSIKNGLASACYESRHRLNTCNVAHKNTSIVPVSFKPLTYINQYIQGDIAASAAASLAVLSTTDGKFTSAHSSSNQRKIVTATFALQIKAFSVAVMNFLWPCAEKKLMDVPRERCGWCIACKGPTTNKKGCLLNLAASNAIKGPARNYNLRANKHHESHLPVIAAQLLIMEESLRGLMVGELFNEHDNEWRKRVREASSCSILKSLVLQLEKNIRRIAFSGGWTRMMDDLSENNKSSNGISRTGGNQKRGNVGRRSKKQSEIMLASSDDNCEVLLWWRGGKVSKAILQTGSIPSSIARKAARQGGRKRIFGISYHECSTYHQRSRQFAWRAAVEMSKSTSQLALQVRYLDAHIRWKEFTRLEQVPMDIKGSETDVLVFRNAFIRDRRILENNILYALDFGDQKHLPLRVTKNILQSEKTQDGNENLWFSEDHLPLYLIKEYEEKVGTCQILPVPAVSMMHNMAKFCRRRLEIYWGDVFTYLTCKRDNPGKCPFCQKDVCLRYAVKCKTCEDYCHLHCSMPSVAKQIDDSKVSRMCQLCYSARSPEPLESSQRAFSRKPLLLRLPVPNISSISQTRPRSISVSEVNSNSVSFYSTPIHEKKTKRNGAKWFTHGIVWRRKNQDSEEGKKFLMENILFKGSNSSESPECCLCKKPYNSNLMYVCCEKCKKWYHADAVLLYENKVLDVVGFKCCKCRRKSSPSCPYSNDVCMELDETSGLDKAVEIGDDMEIQLKSGSSTTSLSNSETENFGMVEFDPFLHSFAKVEPVDEAALEMEDEFDTSIQSYNGQQKHSENLGMVEFDPFLHSFAKVEPVDESALEMEENYDIFIQSSNGPPNYTENFGTAEFDPLLHAFVKVEPEDEADLEMEDKFDAYIQSLDGQQKLPIRRSQVNHKDFENPSFETSPEAENLQNILAPNPMNASWKRPSSLELDNIEMDVQNGIDFENAYDEEHLPDQEADMSGDMEFEPQTYFSFTELLASVDDGPMDMAEHQDVLNDYRGIYSDMPLHNLNRGNEIAVSEEFAFDGLACQKCKLYIPSPDLICDICRLCIHSHCSPWVEESTEASTGSKWRCGNCREWR